MNEGPDMKIRLYLLGLLFAMKCPAFSHPVSMSIQPNGNGSFVMMLENVNGVRALDLDRSQAGVAGKEYFTFLNIS